MSGNSNVEFWQVVRPLKWPKPPSWMSFSTLLEMEACPRRWSLATAEYLGLWKYRGYPSMPHPSALEGTVVHLSLQRIMGALVERGCSSLTDEKAIITLKNLGGYTSIISDSIEQVLLLYRENPRAMPYMEGICNRLTARLPELRTRVQKYLSRTRPEPHAASNGETILHSDGEHRHPLQKGTHTEVLLKATSLRWCGYADVLTLSPDHCEIRDYKTGAQKEKHKLQLLIYALLWARDSDLNPVGRLASKLVLSYDENDVEIQAPEANALHILEKELKERTISVFRDIQADLPRARTDMQNCEYCSVRHLCEEYWQQLNQRCLTSDPLNRKYMDVQIKLTSQHGPSSWDGIVECSSKMKVDEKILLRTVNPKVHLHPGQKLRVLNVYLGMPTEEDGMKGNFSIPVATMGTSSEMFLVPRESE